MTIIGIDLGTTNSLVAYWTENGPVVIPNVFGTHLTPSIVGIDDQHEILVGQVAKERQLTHPQMTTATFKRYMGTQKIYRLGKHHFTPEELSSFVIKSLKADAENHLGEEVIEAVISVPAYFNDMQRTATKRAAELAGLKVERLISEPTAAALAYGIHQKEAETKFMVFDLGGGTFDVSILELFEGILEVKSIAGDNYLGGEDFTGLLMTHFIQHHQLDLLALDHKEKAALYKQAELCKKALSEGQSAEMTLTYKDQLLRRTYDRSEYEKLASQLLLRLRRPIEKAMRDAALIPADLDSVLMIGGASRMQVVRSTVGRIFGHLPYMHINPDEAVALGAAVQAALKGSSRSIDELILTDVCPYTLGIETSISLSESEQEAGYFSPIIERNSPIPISRVQTYTTVSDNQKKIDIKVFQGESRKVEDNVKIGNVTINVPPQKSGREAVDVRFTYDINGILEVESTVKSTGVMTRLIIDNSNSGLSQKKIDERFKELQAIKIHPREKMENKLLLTRGARMFEESLGNRREYIGNLLNHFERVLATQNTQEIEKAAIEVRADFEQMEGWFELE